jgi:hypothetical protein
MAVTIRPKTPLKQSQQCQDTTDITDYSDISEQSEKFPQNFFFLPNLNGVISIAEMISVVSIIPLKFI